MVMDYPLLVQQFILRDQWNGGQVDSQKGIEPDKKDIFKKIEWISLCLFFEIVNNIDVSARAKSILCE